MLNYSQYFKNTTPRANQSARSTSIPQARLTIVEGKQVGEIIFLRSRICLFGRMSEVIVRDELASRCHMQIYFDGNKFILEDLHSFNGTYINNKLVSRPVILQHGDMIRIGKTRLVFHQ